jgi:A/G-specific adenine glycosylase
VDSADGQTKLWERAELLVKAAPSARSHNSALMELGQTVCKVSSPACGQCPVQEYCQAEDPSSLPVKGARAAATEVTERVFFHRTGEGVLLQQETGARRTGLWKLPALPECETLPGVLHKSRYTITRYRVTLWVHEAPVGKKRNASVENQSTRVISHDDLANLPMPSPYRRALNALLADNTFRLEA